MRKRVASFICRPIIIIVVAATRGVLSPPSDSKVIFFLSSLRTCREFSSRPYHFYLLARRSLSPPRCQRALSVANAFDWAVCMYTRLEPECGVSYVPIIIIVVLVAFEPAATLFCGDPEMYIHNLQTSTKWACSRRKGVTGINHSPPLLTVFSIFFLISKSMCDTLSI